MSEYDDNEDNSLASSLQLLSVQRQADGFLPQRKNRVG